MSSSDTSGLYGERGQSGESDEGREQPRVVIRDKRRIDPETGAVRETSSAPSAGSDAMAEEGEATVADMAGARIVGDPADTAKELAERTEDLKRVSAEYANYRRRVDRDRVLIGELAQERLVLDLLPVVDDIDRAREHGDLTGAFKSTADRLAAVLDRAGVQAFGEVGDPFDPGVHEAVLHSENPEITVPTCTHVMRRGYRRGERILRAAMVGVADPADPAPADQSPVQSTDDISTASSATETTQ